MPHWHPRLAPFPAPRQHGEHPRAPSCNPSRPRAPVTPLEASAFGKSPPCLCRPPAAPQTLAFGPLDDRHATLGRGRQGWTAARARTSRRCPSCLTAYKREAAPSASSSILVSPKPLSLVVRRGGRKRRGEEKRREWEEGRKRRRPSRSSRVSQGGGGRPGAVATAREGEEAGVASTAIPQVHPAPASLFYSASQ